MADGVLPSHRRGDCVRLVAELCTSNLPERLLTSNLTIHTGAFHPDLETALFAMIRARKEADPFAPVVILVGATNLARRLERLLLEQGVNLFNVRFVTLAQLARDLNPLSGAGLTSLPKGGVTALSHFEFEHSPDGDPFNDVWRYPGFARSLARSFSDLTEACIEAIKPEWLIEPTRRTTLDKRRRAFTDLYRKHRDRSAGFISPARQYAPPAEPLEALQRAYGAGELIVYGIYDVNEAEWRFLKQILSQLPTDYLFPSSNSPETQSPAYAFAQRLLERLRSEIGATVVPLVGVKRPSQEVFALKQEGVWSGAELSVLRTANPAAEAEIIAGQIAELVFIKRVDPTRIGIILWDAARYRPLLIDALKIARIPVMDRIGRVVADTPIGKAAVALLSLSPVSIKRRELFDLLASGVIQIGSETTQPSAFDLEKIGVESGIIQGGVEVWRNSLGWFEERHATSEKSGEKRRAEVAGVVKALVVDLFARLTGFERAEGFAAQVEAATLILNVLLPTTSERENLTRVISSLAVLDRSGVRFSRTQFMTVVKEALQAVKAETQRDQNGVELLTPLMARGSGFDYLFIPGLVQGSVPASSREDPFLPNDLRQRINLRISGKPNHPLVVRGLRIEEERLLFALALDSAKVKLVLSYSICALGSSKTQTPSRFLLEACRLKAGVQVDAESIKDLYFFKDLTQGDVDPGWERRLLRPTDYPLTLVKRSAPGRLPSLLKTLPRGETSWLSRLTELSAARSLGTEFSHHDGVICTTSNAESGRFSVTALEEWAACPFRYFLTTRLSLKAWEEPEILIQPPNSITGNVIHKALERIYEQALRDGKLPLEGASLAWAKKLVDGILIEGRGKVRRDWPAPETAYAVAEEVWKRRIVGILGRIAGFDEGWTVQSFEKDIRLELRLEGGEGEGERTITLSGRVDRRDASPNGAIRIVDYKTGKVDDPTEISHGTRLQLPIYLMAALEQQTTANREGSTAVYLKIGAHGELSEKKIDGSWLKDNWPEVERIIGIISEGIEAGLFPPTPTTSDQCKSCRVKSACDLRSRTSAAIKMGDPRTVKLQLMRSEQ